ncbi:MAG: carbohydrate-binding family 9-like protein [Planctomycetota bacterium]|nr:carbohydrate-binding family 9-like protein [Planctomycetota bacterium]
MLRALLLLAPLCLMALEGPQLAIPHTSAAPALAAARSIGAPWDQAVLVPALTQSPNPDRVMAESLPATEVRLLWDADALYIRFDCSDKNLYLPYNKHDDPLYKGDVVEVFLDARGDSQQWFEIQVAANNATFDQNLLITTAAESDHEGKLLETILQRDFWLNLGYTMKGLRSAASVDDQGWTVEIAIPAQAASRRLETKNWQLGQKLRLNLLRYDYNTPSGTETGDMLPMNWAPVRDGCPHISPQAMGQVVLAE